VSAFDYEGPEALREPITQALKGVVDPEVAMNIVDIGLVVGVRVDGDALQVRLTMTSPACPVADVIVEDVEDALGRLAPSVNAVQVDLVWEPPWTVERMSERARRFLKA
jgi:metal-sulfur cluster biosynthetic enzyme